MPAPPVQGSGTDADSGRPTEAPAKVLTREEMSRECVIQPVPRICAEAAGAHGCADGNAGHGPCRQVTGFEAAVGDDFQCLGLARDQREKRQDGRAVGQSSRAWPPHGCAARRGLITAVLRYPHQIGVDGEPARTGSAGFPAGFAPRGLDAPGARPAALAPGDRP
jgi:hypothetical protein